MMHRPPRGATMEQLIVCWLIFGTLAGLGFWANDRFIAAIGGVMLIVSTLYLLFGSD
jgi:hypothetical protein